MNCANHPEATAAAYCCNCGKALCESCKREIRGVIYCEPCIAARLQDTIPAAAPAPAVIPAGGPHPALSGVLAGFFPFGVGQAYNGQYSKGLAHMLIFIALVWGADHGSADAFCGIALAGFYVYQIIDAVRSARNIQQGLPAPDPFGLGSLFAAKNAAAPSSPYPAAPTPEVYRATGAALPEPSRHSAPVGALWLIALGILFLLTNLGGFHWYWYGMYWPVILIFLGAWLGWKRLSSQRCHCPRCRSHCFTGPAILLTLGVLLLLGELHIAPFARTWPILLIALGLGVIFKGHAPMTGHEDATQSPPAVPQPAGPTDNPQLTGDPANRQNG